MLESTRFKFDAATNFTLITCICKTLVLTKDHDVLSLSLTLHCVQSSFWFSSSFTFSEKGLSVILTSSAALTNSQRISAHRGTKGHRQVRFKQLLFNFSIRFHEPSAQAAIHKEDAVWRHCCLHPAWSYSYATYSRLSRRLTGIRISEIDILISLTLLVFILASENGVPAFLARHMRFYEQLVWGDITPLASIVRYAAAAETERAWTLVYHEIDVTGSYAIYHLECLLTSSINGIAVD